jgi:amino acid transporter
VIAIHHRRPLLILPIALLALFILWLGMVTMAPLPEVTDALPQHAVLRHGGDAVRAKDCLDKNHTGFVFSNPHNKRIAVACWLGDKWGIIILTGAWVVITAFITTKLKTAQKLKNYMHRQGYE